jgi:hypothetical protein
VSGGVLPLDGPTSLCYSSPIEAMESQPSVMQHLHNSFYYGFYFTSHHMAWLLRTV